MLQTCFLADMVHMDVECTRAVVVVVVVVVDEWQANSKNLLELFSLLGLCYPLFFVVSCFPFCIDPSILYIRYIYLWQNFLVERGNYH